MERTAEIPGHDPASRLVERHRAIMGMIEDKRVAVPVENTDIDVIFENLYDTPQKPLIRLQRREASPNEPGSCATYGILDCRTSEWRFSTPVSASYSEPADLERIEALDRVVVACMDMRADFDQSDIELLLAHSES